MRKSPLTIVTAVFVSVLLSVPDVQSQHLPIEWMMRIPKYFRLKGGSSQFVSDPMRGALLFDGGPYDTYVTYDKGDTWQTIFDMRMFYVDVMTTWRADTKGNWYYEGRVYNKYVLNMVTEDAGKTLRYLVMDSSMVYQSWLQEGAIRIAPPDGVYMTIDRGADPVRRGIYSTCDVGRTWKHILSPNYITQGYLSPVGPDIINIPILDLNKWVEYNLCTGSKDTTGLDAREEYLRLDDGTILQWYSRYYNYLNVTKPGADTFVAYTMYKDVERDTLRKFFPMVVSKASDTMALIIAKQGVVATYGMKSGFKFIDIPPFRNQYQQVCDYGMHGERILLRTVVPAGTSDATSRFTLINTRTGVTKTYVRPSAVAALPLLSFGTGLLYENQRLMPYSDSVWLASFQQGELMRTTDAGATWKMVDNIDRDERWGMTNIGVTRLFPRGDGTMSVLTERSRLMVQDSATKVWSIAHLGPFSHTLTLPPNTTSSFTGSKTIFGEDISGKLRCRYGPSTAMFYSPDSLWTTGDVVTRWTPKGEFIDTVLNRHARVLKRVGQKLVVAAMDSVWFSWTNGKAWTFVSKNWPALIQGTDTVRSALGDIVEADNKVLIAGLRGVRQLDSLYEVVDSIPGGLLISADSGNTWSRSAEGVPDNLYVSSLIKLETGTLLCLALEVTIDPSYIDFNGLPARLPSVEIYQTQYKLGLSYIYRSADDGRTWTRVHTFSSREFLPNVDPRFVLMPDGRPMAIHPEVGIAISPNDGLWFSVGDPLYVGNPNISDVVFTGDGYAHCATDSGYLRIPIDRIMDVRDEQQTVGTLNTYVNASHVLTISAADFVPQTLRVLSLDGRTVKHGTNVNGITELDLSTLATGTYVVTASSPSELRSGLIQIY